MVSEETGDSQSSSGEAEKKGEQRRGFLKSAVVLSVVFVLAGLLGITRVLSAPAAPEPVEGASTGTVSTAPSGFPRVKIANLSDLQLNKPVYFNYPLDDEPNILVKVGQKADGGVGPDGDVVAFSQVCQHLGCIYGFQGPGSSPLCNPSFTATIPQGYCCCHGGQYDFIHGAKVIAGPPPRPLPQVTLEVDSGTGDVFATGMTAPTIFGHDTGSTNVSADLQGGNLVS